MADPLVGVEAEYPIDRLTLLIVHTAELVLDVDTFHDQHRTVPQLDRWPLCFNRDASRAVAS